MTSHTQKHTGSCYCKSITFEVTDEIQYVCHCHCNQCQKIHAAAFATWVGFYTTSYKIHDPHKQYKSFKGKYAERGFCANCGSHFFFRYHNLNYPSAKENEIAFARACFDSTPHFQPEHIFFAEKKDWYEIHDNLPKRD